MATSISAILIPCLKSFNKLQEQVEQPDYGHDQEVAPASWGDELGRLRVWAANIGAHQTGQSSLDFRLRDASHISKQITKLLRELEQSLHEILKELSDDSPEASDYDEPDAFWPGGEPTTELQQLYEEVANIIDCLYQLSMLIRKPAQHDLLIGTRLSDKAEFDFYDKEHVRNLHPQTEEQTSQRLGRAITRRRKYLLYRERHHRKLEEGIEEVQGIQRAATWGTMSETIATDFQTPNIDFDDTSSNSGFSETSYAPSLIDGGRITVPPPPKGSVGGKPFECPYCYFIIDIKSTRSWNRHIFKDIKPYVCTFPDCSMSDRLYDSRREWYFHEKTEHHREDVCPFCRDSLSSSKQYERHVGRHLEELALFALPRTEIDDAEDDDEDKDVFDSEDPLAADSASNESSVEGEEGLDSSSLSGQNDDPASGSGIPKYSDMEKMKMMADLNDQLNAVMKKAGDEFREAASHDPSDEPSPPTANERETETLGGRDLDAIATTQRDAVAYSRGFRAMQRQQQEKAMRDKSPKRRLDPISSRRRRDPDDPRFDIVPLTAQSHHEPPDTQDLLADAEITLAMAKEPEKKKKSLLSRLWPKPS